MNPCESNVQQVIWKYPNCSMHNVGGGRDRNSHVAIVGEDGLHHMAITQTGE